MLNRGLLSVTIATLVIIASFSTIMMKASCGVLHNFKDENTPSVSTNSGTVNSITDGAIPQNVLTDDSSISDKRFESLNEKTSSVESKKAVAEPTKPFRYREWSEGPCPVSIDPFITPLHAANPKRPRPIVLRPEIKELLRRINLDEADVPDDILFGLNERQIKRELAQSASFELDPYMEWLNLTSEPGKPSRLSRMVNGEADEYGDDDWLKMFEGRDHGFKELRSKKNRPLLDEFFYYELSKRVLSGQGAEEYNFLRKMVDAIRAARKMYLWGACYLIWSQRESLVLLPHAIGFTVSVMCTLWAILLTMFICWRLWRETRMEMASMINADNAPGYTAPSWSFLLGTLTGWEYLIGMAKHCVWGATRPSLERAMRRHQPTRWWDMFCSAPRMEDWSDLDEEEDKTKGGKDGKRKRQTSSFASSRRNSPSRLDGSSSEESEDEQQDDQLVLERILPGKKKTINRSVVTKPVPPVARVPTPPQPHQQQQRRQSGGSNGDINSGNVSLTKHRDTFKKTFVPASTPTNTNPRSTHSKPAVPDAPFKPAMSFADAMVVAKLSATSSAVPSCASSPPPGMSSRASSTHSRSRLLPYIMEEDAHSNNLDNGLASARSLHTSSSSTTLNNEFMSGFTSPTFSLFSNNMMGGQPSTSTDTPADNLLMDVLLRRSRQQSVDENMDDGEGDGEGERGSASDSEITFVSRFLRNRKGRPH